MIPTLLGISFVCFLLIQLIPGGPVEQKIAQLQMIAGETGGADASKVLSADEIYSEEAKLRRLYFLNKDVEDELNTAFDFDFDLDELEMWFHSMFCFAINESNENVLFGDKRE